MHTFLKNQSEATNITVLIKDKKGGQKVCLLWKFRDIFLFVSDAYEVNFMQSELALRLEP